MLLEAELRLEDRRVGELVVDLEDPPVGPVVEPAIGGDRPVDAMHHADVIARVAAQPAEVEVERVVEAGRRPAREPVALDLKASPLELTDERAQELVTAAPRAVHELVEDGDVRAAAPRCDPIDLGRDATGEEAAAPASQVRNRAGVHARECRRAASRRRPWSAST